VLKFIKCIRYLCGEMTFKYRRRFLTPLIMKCCEHYFGCKVGDQDKCWPPNLCCLTCARILPAREKISCCMPLVIPIVWREPTDRVSDCYFCLTYITAVIAKSKHSFQYPNLPSAMRGQYLTHKKGPIGQGNVPLNNYGN
jgi:hypothetical protein